MAWLLSASICDYNPPIILLGLAIMAILWYAAHCVSCWRSARKMLREARSKLELMGHPMEAKK